jgi:hypothetical protein
MHQPGHIDAFKATLLQNERQSVRGKLGLQDNSRGIRSGFAALQMLYSYEGAQLFQVSGLVKGSSASDRDPAASRSVTMIPK